MIYVTVNLPGFGIVTRRYETREEAESFVETLREKYGADAFAEPTYRTQSEQDSKLARGCSYFEFVDSYES